MGLRPLPGGPFGVAQGGLRTAIAKITAAYIVGADPVADDPHAREILEGLSTVVVQDLFLSATAELADVVLPAQSFVEREGTFTSGERRVQRWYPAVRESEGSLADYRIIAELGARMGVELEGRGASLVFSQVAAQIPDYGGLSYAALAVAEPQWPDVGGEDLYYGGTAYDNRQGLGAQLKPKSGDQPPMWAAPEGRSPEGDLLLIPVSRLYDRGGTIVSSEILKLRVARLRMAIHPKDAARLDLLDVSQAEVTWDGTVTRLDLLVEDSVPPGAGLVPRSMGLPLREPTAVRVRPVRA